MENNTDFIKKVHKELAIVESNLLFINYGLLNEFYQMIEEDGSEREARYYGAKKISEQALADLTKVRTKLTLAIKEENKSNVK